MKKIILLLLFCGCNFCFSQDSNKTPKGQHTIFAEGFGNVGLWYSVGYDYTLKLKEKHKLSFNCGFQYIPYHKKHFTFSLPAQISYLYGKNHHVELGAGGTYQLYRFNDEHDKNWIIPFRIGYRYQRENGGFFFKIAYTPVYTNVSFFNDGWWFMPLFAGIAVGYTFK
jgi:hypothetical protein